MESFGNILKTTRESKEISIETVVRETTISRQYIESLENENLDVFPGHTYIIGFLRTYSEYLELDPTHLIHLFQAKIIQEAPIPEKLIAKQRNFSIKKTIFIILGSIAITIGIFCFFFFIIFAKQNDDGVENIDIAHNENVKVTLSNAPIEKRLYEGDVIEVPLSGHPVELTVKGTLSVFSLETPVGIQFVELGEELEMDVDGENGTDIILFLSDISKTDAKRGAEVRMLMKDGVAIDSVESQTTADEFFTENQVEKEASSDKTVIFNDNRAYPFSLKITFRGVCLFRSQIDNDESVEEYFSSGDTKTLTANNGVKLWMSNSNSAKLQVIADGKYVDLEIGRAGQVSVKEIRWIKESVGVYKLVEYEVN